MGIDLYWYDETGALRDEAPDQDSTLSDLIDGIREERSTRKLLLATIDPYGTTRFTGGQAPQLLRELELLREEVASPDRRIRLGRFISILRAAQGARGDLLEFAGD